MRSILILLLVGLCVRAVISQDSLSNHNSLITPTQHQEVADDLDWSETKKVWRPRTPEEPVTQPKKPTTPVLLSGPIFQILGYAVIIIIALLIVYLVFKNVNIESLPSKEDFTPVDLSNAKDIHEIDVETELEKALREGDYRRAFSMKYVLLLQYLSTEKKIIWRPYKTNRDYLHELSGYQDIQTFRTVTHAFENSLYGTTPFGIVEYEEFAPQIDSIIQTEIERAHE